MQNAQNKKSAESSVEIDQPKREVSKFFSAAMTTKKTEIYAFVYKRQTDRRHYTVRERRRRQEWSRVVYQWRRPSESSAHATNLIT